MAVVCKEMNVASDHRLRQGPQMGKEKKSRFAYRWMQFASTTVGKGGLQSDLDNFVWRIAYLVC